MARKGRGRGGNNIRATLAALKKQQEEEKRRRLREARVAQQQREREQKAAERGRVMLGKDAVSRVIPDPGGKWSNGGISYTVKSADDPRAGNGAYFFSMDDGQGGHGTAVYDGNGNMPDVKANRDWVEVIKDIFFE